MHGETVKKTIMDKCELSLIYMGPGKFAEMIPLVVNSDEQTAQRTNVTSTNTKVSATRAKSVSTENSTKDTCCENTSKNKRTKLTSVSTENSTAGVVTTENTSNTRLAGKNDTTREVSFTSTKPSGSNKRKPRPNLVEMVRATELRKSSRVMRSRKPINYADMNTGIDSEPDMSLPRKKKYNIAASLKQPSATVIAAHQQRFTRQGLNKMFPSPLHKSPRLVGTVIISPPAKTVINERDIKQEEDWLKLPKNVPKDTRSLMDPTVKFTIKHSDGSICHHKKTWAFYNRELPLKDSELPDLEEPKIVNTQKKYNLRNTTSIKDVTVNVSSCLEETHSKLTQNTDRDTSVHTENRSHKGDQNNSTVNSTATTENVKIDEIKYVNTEKLKTVSTENSQTGKLQNSGNTSDPDASEQRNQAPSKNTMETVHTEN